MNGKNICKSNLAPHAVYSGHEFPYINNMTLIRHVPHKGTTMNIYDIHKHKSNIVTYTNQYKRHNTIFKTLKLGHSKITNVYSILITMTPI